MVIRFAEHTQRAPSHFGAQRVPNAHVAAACVVVCGAAVEFVRILEPAVVVLADVTTADPAGDQEPVGQVRQMDAAGPETCPAGAFKLPQRAFEWDVKPWGGARATRDARDGGVRARQTTATIRSAALDAGAGRAQTRRHRDGPRAAHGLSAGSWYVDPMGHCVHSFSRRKHAPTRS